MSFGERKSRGALIWLGKMEHPTGGLFGGDDTWVNSKSYGTGIETRFWLVFCFLVFFDLFMTIKACFRL